MPGPARRPRHAAASSRRSTSSASSTPTWARPSRWSRCSPRARASACTTATRRIAASTSSGAGTHPGAGVPGVRELGQGHGGPDAGTDLGLVPRRVRCLSGDPARGTLPRDDPRGLEELRRRGPALRRRHARAGLPALRLVPPLRRPDRRPAPRLRHARRTSRADAPRAGSTRLRRQTRAVPSRGEPIGDPVFAGLQRVVARARDPASATRSSCSPASRWTCRAGATPASETCSSTATTSPASVGLMMAYVMGVRDEATLQRAADLGIALQLTNIARDVARRRARRARLPAARAGWREAGVARRGARRAAPPRRPWPRSVRAAARRGRPLLRLGDAGSAAAAAALRLGRGDGARRLLARSASRPCARRPAWDRRAVVGRTEARVGGAGPLEPPAHGLVRRAGAAPRAQLWAKRLLE